MNKIVMAHIAATISSIRSSLSEAGPELGYDLAKLEELDARYDELAGGASPWHDELADASRWLETK